MDRLREERTRLARRYVGVPDTRLHRVERGKHRAGETLSCDWIAADGSTSGRTPQPSRRSLSHPRHLPSLAQAKNDVARALSVLESHLLSSTYLVGQSVTLADIVVCCSLLNAFKLVADGAYLAPYPCVVRWFTTCVNQPEFLAVLGTTNMCGAGAAPAATAPAPKEEGGKKNKKEKAPKEPKAPKEQKPKEEKKARRDGCARCIPEIYPSVRGVIMTRVSIVTS